MKITNEAKVGVLIVLSLLFLGAFGWVVGFKNPFQNDIKLYVTYNFAGGIELGSPVRVSGIKVGQVEAIEFFSPLDPEGSDSNSFDNKKDLDSQTIVEPLNELFDSKKTIVPLKVKVSIRKDAAKGVRQDSKFFINLAGIIGERYIEITPGHIRYPSLKDGDIVAGIDPPRLDQLLSQSFDLAGRVKDVIEGNKKDLTKSLELLVRLSSNLNRTLEWIDKSAIFKTNVSGLMSNLITLTGDIKDLTKSAKSEDVQKSLKLLNSLLFRLEPLDAKTIQTFFHKEGIKVKFF